MLTIWILFIAFRWSFFIEWARPGGNSRTNRLKIFSNDLCDWDDPKTKPKYPPLAYKESISSSCRRTLCGLLFNTIPSSDTYHSIAHCWDHELVRKGRGSPFLQIKNNVRWWISRNSYIFFTKEKEIFDLWSSNGNQEIRICNRITCCPIWK